MLKLHAYDFSYIGITSVILIQLVSFKFFQRKYKLYAYNWTL